MFDRKSAIDKLAAKKREFDKIENQIDALKSNLKNSTSLTDAQELDTLLNSLVGEAQALMHDIAALQKKLDDEGDFEMNNSKVKHYEDTAQAVKDWADIYRNSASKEDAESKWRDKLVENGVNIDGKTELLPTQVDLGIQSVIEDNPIFDIMQHVSAGTLVYKKFDTKDTAVVRGTGYNITENKVEQNATLDVKDLPQNEIYKLTTVSYKAMKTMGSELDTFIAQELTQNVINKIIDLALYDGTGTASDNNAGFDSVVASDSAAVHVEYPKGSSLAQAIQANSFRATGGGATVIDNSGASTGQQNRVLIVNSDDYSKILGEALKLSYQVENIPKWLGVDSVIITKTTSKNYKPIVMTKNAYIVAMDDFDKFDWYNVLSNRNTSEVVALANGTLFQANSAVVFTEAGA